MCRFCFSAKLKSSFSWSVGFMNLFFLVFLKKSFLSLQRILKDCGKWSELSSVEVSVETSMT